MPDFGAYYAAGWAVRLGLHLYDWPATVRELTARGVVFPEAVRTLPVDYPPFFVYLIVPFTLLPYGCAQILWSAVVIATLWLSARLLAKACSLSPWVIVGATLAFSPITFGLAWGNSSPLMLLGLLSLAASMTTDRPRLLALVPFVIVAVAKLFPTAWVLPLIGARKWRRLLEIALLVVVAVAIMLAADPGLTAGFIVHFLDPDSPALGDPTDQIVQQSNVLGAVMHVTQPHILGDYHRFGVSVPGKTVSPLCPVPLGAARRAGVALSAVLFAVVVAVSWRLSRRGQSKSALYALAAGVLVVQPYTLYYYLVVLLPPLLALVASRDKAVRWVGVVAYWAIGLGRFPGLLTAVLPTSLFVVATQFGTLGAALVWVGVLLGGRISRSEEAEVSPAPSVA
jgi:hypothetical protein